MPEAAVPLRDRIIQELDEIKDPCSCAAGTPLGLAEMGLIKSVDISDDGTVAVMLRLTAPFCHMIGFFTTEVKDRVGALSGVSAVTLRADNGLDWSPDLMSEAGKAKRTRQFTQAAAA